MTPTSRFLRKPLLFVATMIIAVLVPTLAWAAGQTGDSAEQWLRHILPQALFRVGPRGLMWWQWMAFPVLAAVAWIVGRLFGGLTRSLLLRASRRTRTAWDDRLLASVGPALTILWALLAFRVFLPLLGLGPHAEGVVVQGFLGTLAIVTTFWALWRSVGVFSSMLLEQPWAAGNPSAHSLLAVAGNFIRAGVAVGGVVTVLAAFGFPVATALAGLGIGGIALAFGAQKTVENLFGFVAIAADQPCQVGDFVKVDDFTGTVERIGSRSTRIRTLDRTLITIPNGRFSETRIETFAVRDRIRFATTLALSYETTESQMRAVLNGVEQILRQHPKVWPDTRVVRFAGFGDTALQIEVLCWFETADYEEFRAYRQDALFGFMQVVADAGAIFAHSVRTVRVVSETAPRIDP